MKHSLFSPLQKLLDQSLTPGALRLLLVSMLAWSPAQADSNTSSSSGTREAPSRVVQSGLLQQILAAPHRQASSARDRYRHPAATLQFFEVEPQQTVMEIWPGASGWYSEILAPYLKDNGRFIAAHFPTGTNTGYFERARNSFMEKARSQPELYGAMEVVSFDPGASQPLAPANSVDRILTFRNAHNWYMNGGENGVKQAFSQFLAALKPGGILGVVDHRLAPEQPLSAQKNSGYMNQDDVIRMAREAGFELVATSEINANPLDNREHTKGVWSLPPTLQEGDHNRDAYLAIGESDRMTLKFRKPLAGHTASPG